MLSCDIADVNTQLEGCSEQYAGLGGYIYAVDPRDLVVKPAYSEEAGEARFQAYSFDKANFKNGTKAIAIKIKKTSGQNQGTGIEGPKGHSQSLTFVVDNDTENAAATLRVIKNKGDFYFLAPFGADGKYQVIGDPVYGSTLNANYDSGTTADSDSGITVTAACPAAPFCVVLWVPTPGTSSEGGFPVGSVLASAQCTGLLANTENGAGTYTPSSGGGGDDDGED